MTLLDEIEAAWKPEHVAKVDGWAADLEKSLSFFAKASKRFKVTSPLDVYLTVSRAKQSTARFSVRFLGQEVAELRVKEEGVLLAISKKLAETNNKYFEIAEQGVFPWNSPRGIAFRKHFKAVV